MSPFNKCLEICETDAAREYFRTLYWSFNSKYASQRDAKALKLKRLQENINEYDYSRACEAIRAWNNQPKKKTLRHSLLTFS